MKAIRLHGRGGPDHLVYEEVPKPHIGPGEVLVRVAAAGIIVNELRWDETYQTAAEDHVHCRFLVVTSPASWLR